MAVHKKPKKKTAKDLKVFKWTPQRRKAAELLSTGLYYQREVANQLNLSEVTLSIWCQHPDFKQEVDRLTLLQENANRSGIVRKILKAMDIKENYIAEDRNTFLDCIELMLKVMPEDSKKDDDKMKALTDAILNSAKMIGK